jgi:photosystem II stability/assembly factor-like uncharacterized protein
MVAAVGLLSHAACGHDVAECRWVLDGDAESAAFATATDAGLRSIDVYAGVGVAVGERGTILRLEDVANARDPIAPQAALLPGPAGDASWLDSTPVGAEADEWGLLLVGESGQIRFTTDSGASWTPLTSGVTVDLELAMWTADQAEILVAGEGVVLRIPAGAAEQLGRSTLPDGWRFAEWGHWDADLVAIGSGGLLARSPDEGTTWERVTVPTSVDLRSLAGATTADDSSVLVAGCDDGSLVVGDFERGFESVQTPLTSAIVAFASASVTQDPPEGSFESRTPWWIVDDRGGLAASSNDGETWESFDVELPDAAWRSAAVEAYCTDLFFCPSIAFDVMLVGDAGAAAIVQVVHRPVGPGCTSQLEG